MTEQPEPRDALDRFLRDARPQPPDGLNERILAGVASAAAAQRAYWEDVKASAQTAIIVSIAVLVIAAVFAGMTLLGAEPAEQPAPTPTIQPADEEEDDEIGYDQLALLEQQLENELWLGGGE